jgi:hypothetical protein
MSKRFLLLACLVLSACSSADDDTTTTDAPKASATVDPARIAEQQAAAEANRLRGLWTYQGVTLKEGVQHSAAIYSYTVPVEEGEIAPVADAELVLRDHPSWGRSAYLLLAQSRFSCGKPCAMTIAFDDGEVRRFSGKQADSGKGPALFIEDEAAFIAALKQAKKLRIVLPKGSGIVSTLNFEVGGYDPTQYH